MPHGVGVVAFVGLVVLLLLRLPVGLSMMLVAVLGQAYLLGSSAALARLGSDTVAIVANAPLIVIPLFTLMGLFLSNAHLGADLYGVVGRLLGRVPGALAMATIGASALFSAVCGSSVATTLTMAVVAVPEMKRHHYDERLAAGAAAAGGTLGVLIPPSALLVLYGILTEESIGRTLIGGILPGLLTAALLMATAYLVARRRPPRAPVAIQDAPATRSAAVGPLSVVAATFGLSMGGLYAGLFTPTEAASVGAFLALVFGVATGRLGRGGIAAAVEQAVRLSATLFVMLIGGTMFGYFLTLTRIPADLARSVAGLALAPPVVMLLIFAIYFVLGALMDELAILLIMTPVVYPVAIAIGYDGVWFGVQSILMLLTGMLTPPVGLLSFVTSSATGISLDKVYSGVTPFWLALILANVLLILCPDIALVLPNLMMR